jgi:hypothetical protein
MSKSVVVIGAGISGLNCARILNDAGFQVQVVESRNRVGGRMATDVIDGFTLDHGFQVINPAYSELKAAGAEKDLKLHNLPKGVEIFNGKEMILLGDPRTDLRYLRAALSSTTGSWGEKLNFLRFLTLDKPDQRFADAMKKSEVFYHQIIKRFLSGVFLTNPDEVSAKMAQELLRWFIKGAPGLPQDGAQALPALLSKDLDIALEHEVLKLEHNSVITTRGELKADVIVIAVNQVQAHRLLGKEIATMNQSTTWYHSLPAGIIDSSYLRLDNQDKIVNSIAISNIVSNYAPSDKTLISTTTLIKASEGDIRSTLTRIWGLPMSTFEYLKHYEISDSLPKHLPGKPLITPVKLDTNLYAVGDYKAVPSQQGAMMSGRLAAEIIIKG